ncbi:hypothetical protein PF007_g1653 [Phytophthora fragariae]|uniref:Protein kinase domain-containing protein n=1 Tax=Phytophthora fragariae TaxID=53985 RepID=A0A6A3TJT3_9STRA|nr:hypothetical protein PF007_g1653 [Phytophthora fragariae]
MAEGSNILTTNCSDRCGESTPCIVQAVDGDSDDYSCLQGYANLESATFVLNNGYGADSTKNIDTIGVMELGTATTQIIFAVGNNSGQVSPVELSPDFAIKATQVTDVAMKQKQSGPVGSENTPTKKTKDSSISIWQDPHLLAIQLKGEEIEDRLRKVFETHQNMQNFLEKIKMVVGFDHPNIVKLVGAAWTMESGVQALSEYMAVEISVNFSCIRTRLARGRPGS